MSSGRTSDDFKNQTSGWFVDSDGTKTGPYFLEQIMSMIQSGQIAPHHRLTAIHLKGEWMSAQDLMGVKRAPGAPFAPPPRPGAIETQAVMTPPQAEDPAASLFDALQVVREKKQSRLLPEIRFRGGGLSSGDWLAKNPWAPVIFLTAIVVVSLLWGMIAFMKKSPILAQLPQNSASAPVLPAAVPVSPPPIITQPASATKPEINFPSRTRSGINKPLPAPIIEPARREEPPENRVDGNPSPGQPALENDPNSASNPEADIPPPVQVLPPQEQ